jgi:uncharacterized protein
VKRSAATALARLLLAGAGLAAYEARAELPPPPTRWVTDSAAFLSDSTRQELDGQLEAYERQTGHHVLVWIGRTTGGVPLEDFTVRAFAAWRVGNKGLDDGIVLFVFTDDRTLRVEVGYGLEGQVPDAVASRILRETITPRMQTGERDAAIRDSVAALIAAVEGRAWTPAPGAGPAPGRARPVRSVRALGIGQKILIGLLVVGFLILFATNPSLAAYLLFSVLSGGRGGGGRGGSEYSGGGGRSGGGGASGSW